MNGQSFLYIMYFSYPRGPRPPPLWRLARPAGWGFEYSVTGHITYRYIRFSKQKQKRHKSNTEKDNFISYERSVILFNKPKDCFEANRFWDAVSIGWNSRVALSFGPKVGGRKIKEPYSTVSPRSYSTRANLGDFGTQVNFFCPKVLSLNLFESVICM
jgi:hypothetical protein